MHKRWSKVVIFAMFFLFCFTFVMILNIDHWSTVLSQFVPGLSAYIYALSIEGIQNTILLHVHYQRSSLRHHQPTMCPTIFFPFLLFTGRLWCSNPPSTNPTVNRFEHISSIICPLLLSAPLMNPLSRAHRDSHLMSCMAASHHNDEIRYKHFTFSGKLFSPMYCCDFGFSVSVQCGKKNLDWKIFVVIVFRMMSLCGKCFQSGEIMRWTFSGGCGKYFQSGKFVWQLFSGW